MHPVDRNLLKLCSLTHYIPDLPIPLLSSVGHRADAGNRDCGVRLPGRGRGYEHISLCVPVVVPAQEVLPLTFIQQHATQDRKRTRSWGLNSIDQSPRYHAERKKSGTKMCLQHVSIMWRSRKGELMGGVSESQFSAPFLGGVWMNLLECWHCLSGWKFCRPSWW